MSAPVTVHFTVDVECRAEHRLRSGVEPAYGYGERIWGRAGRGAELGLRRVTGACFADNIASSRVMEKCGMRREQHGVRDSWHAELGWIDGYTYAILAEEWKLVE